MIKSVSSKLNEIHAHQVEIKKQSISFKKANIYAEEIECTDIVAECLTCKKLCATNVKLAKTCVIDYLEYSGKLEMENGATVKEIVKL